MRKLKSNSVDELVEMIFMSFSMIPEKAWIIGFSGGKDSSLLVDLAVEYVSEYDQEISLHIIYADTLIEYPMVRDYAYEFLDRIDFYRRKKDLRIYTYRVKPDIGRDFLSLQLIKGYPMPHRKFRWCTEKLKIIPARSVIESIIKEYGESNTALLNGSRLDESTYRSGIMKKRVRGCRDCIDPVTGCSTKYILRLMKRKTGVEFSEGLPFFVTRSRGFKASVKVYSPFAYLREEDIWSIIKSRIKPSFTDKPLYRELLKLYGKYGGRYLSDHSIRFGCWLCTVATKDKSGEYFIKVYKDRRKQLEIIKWARNALFTISHKAPEIFRKEGRFPKQEYNGLNEYGLELTRTIYYIVYMKYREAFKSYLEEPIYREQLNNLLKINREKVLNIIETVLVSKNIPEEVRKTLVEIKDYLGK
ncbi:MAG: hypothetical protein B6U89_02685 [Desulfurococcales archaeon ex4484_58]|nr:MAG: hypothetical protein B6U89_02685 [Desulfurococcales archaeon ex4484_58]